MGFLNINGQTLHTSSIGGVLSTTGSISATSSILSSGISSSSTLITSGGTPYYILSGSNVFKNTTIYHVLGDDIEVSAYSDANLAITISTLNILGKPFYDELMKNNFSFPTEIEDYLKVKFRDIKIDEILNKKLKS